MAQVEAVEAAPVRLSRGYKVTWGVAALGTSLIGGIYAALLTIFYQDYLGLQARWWVVASPIYAIWNALNDPLLGYLSDRTHSRHGRRVPYMRYTTPLLAFTFILMWFAPRRAGQVGLFAWMLGTMLLYDTAYTVIGLVYSALLPEVSESDAERNDLQISSRLFGLLGILLGFIIPDLFRPKMGSTSLLPLQLAMALVAVISAVLILITAFRVKERPEFYQADRPLRLGVAIKYTLTSRSFLVLVAENFMIVLMHTLLMGGAFYLADYVLQMNTLIVLACVFIPLFVGVPVTSLLRRRFGVVGTQQRLLLLAGIALVLILVVPVPLILVCLAVTGFALAGPQTLTNVLFAQVADEDELRSGVRREGTFFGINALLTKPAQSVALALSPAILEMTRFVTRESQGGQIYLDQPESALLGIRIAVGLIPGVAALLGALILIWFPLRGEYLQRVQAAVLTLHARKRAQLARR